MITQNCARTFWDTMLEKDLYVNLGKFLVKYMPLSYYHRAVTRTYVSWHSQSLNKVAALFQPSLGIVVFSVEVKHAECPFKICYERSGKSTLAKSKSIMTSISKIMIIAFVTKKAHDPLAAENCQQNLMFFFF